MEYTEVYRGLMEKTAILTFLKKDGKIRNMLATRCMQTINLCDNVDLRAYDGHDKRCGIDNGNVAVIDLVIEESRSFNIGRLISIDFIGHIDTKDKLEGAIEQFKAFREEYEKNNVMELTMDTFKNTDKPEA